MKRIAGLVIAFIAFFLIPIQVLAVDFTIEQMHIDVQLQENGDAHVIETQVYKFDSSFNGITRTLMPKEGTTIEDFKAMEKDTNLKVEQEGNLFKIHRKGDTPETVTIKVSYTIKEGVEVYEDAAQFYWAFFDDSNESEYEQFDITVHPPKQTTDVMALGYDAAEETEEIQDDGSVYFSLGWVSSGVNGDIRAVYDKSLFPSASLTEDRPIKDEITAEQKKRADEQIAFEKRKNTLESSAPFVLGFYGIVLIFLLWFARQKKQMTRADVERRYTAPYFVPEETMSLPATIFYATRTGFANVQVLTAALLDLVRKKVVKQTDQDAFEVIHQHPEYEHEKHLVDWLFYKVGQDGVFSVNDLEEYAKDSSSASTYQQDYHTWRKLVQDEVQQNELYERYPRLKVGLGMLGVILIPLTILYAVHDLFLYMFLAGGLFVSLILFIFSFRPRTVKGVKIQRDWNEFIEKYVEFEDKDWEDLHDDEQKRAYLYSFGVNDKRVQDKNEWFLNREPNIVYADPNPMYFLLFASIANNHFHDAHTTSAASSTPSGTGMISGGGGGVGGGGGGSGAF